MYGLAVRWSLDGTADDLAATLREYVTGSSVERFTGMPGLRFKTWRMRSGEWFEGTYVFADSASRDAFLAGFREQAPTSPVSGLAGAPPVLMEIFEVVAVAEGGEGFDAGPGPGAA